MTGASRSIAVAVLVFAAAHFPAHAADEVERTRAVLNGVFHAIGEYVTNTGQLPPANALYDALTAPPPVLSLPPGAVKGRAIIDLWGRPIRYVPGEGGSFVVYSVGANGRDENGGGDDFGYRR